MVREVLGVELNDMDFSERWRAIFYSWASFNSRSQLFKPKPQTEIIEIENEALDD